MIAIIERLRNSFRAGSKKAPYDFAAPLDVLADDFVRDPFPIYDILRVKRPVVPLKNGGVLLSRHEDIFHAFSDKRLSNRPSRFSPLRPGQADKYTAAALACNIPPFQDLPEHRATRMALIHAFKKAFATFDQRLPQLAADLMVAKESSRSLELLSEVATPFSAVAICSFLGIRWEHAAIGSFAEAFFALFGPIRDLEEFANLNTRMDEARGFIGASIAAGNIAKDSFAGYLLKDQLNGEGLGKDVLVDLILLVAADGIKNIEAGIVSGFRILHEQPHYAQQVAEGISPDPFVREALRLETPAQVLPRIAKENFSLHGVEIKADFPVYLALGSANRDPEVFSNPTSYHPHRAEAGEVTFGQGKHRCIGEPLAVATIGSMLQCLLRRGVKPAKQRVVMQYHKRFGHRWPKAYPVEMP